MLQCLMFYILVGGDPVQRENGEKLGAQRLSTPGRLLKSLKIYANSLAVQGFGSLKTEAQGVREKASAGISSSNKSLHTLDFQPEVSKGRRIFRSRPAHECTQMRQSAVCRRPILACANNLENWQGRRTPLFISTHWARTYRHRVDRVGIEWTLD